jgi:hypothetical protein
MVEVSAAITWALITFPEKNLNVSHWYSIAICRHQLFGGIPYNPTPIVLSPGELLELETGVSYQRVCIKMRLTYSNVLGANPLEKWYNRKSHRYKLRSLLLYMYIKVG